MDIIFETNGSTAPLKQWLEAFKEIDESLLIEIDLADDMFVAKSFTPDRTIVKYGKISFEQCNMSVVNMLDDEGRSISVSEWLANNSGRVYAGFLHNLGNFIKTVGVFSGEDVHKIIVRFTNADGRFQASKVEFKSIKLNMITPCFKLTEFNMKMADDSVFFNNVAAIQNPISFKITPDVNKRLITISEIGSKDPKKDILSFVVSDEEDGVVGLYGKDLTNQNYNYCMSNEVVNGGEDIASSAQSPVTRANYMIAIKGDIAETSVITLSKESVQNGRMKIETSDGMFTTIIANVRV